MGSMDISALNALVLRASCVEESVYVAPTKGVPREDVNMRENGILHMDEGKQMSERRGGRMWKP